MVSVLLSFSVDAKHFSTNSLYIKIILISNKYLFWSCWFQNLRLDFIGSKSQTGNRPQVDTLCLDVLIRQRATHYVIYYQPDKHTRREDKYQTSGHELSTVVSPATNKFDWFIIRKKTLKNKNYWDTFRSFQRPFTSKLILNCYSSLQKSGK